MSGNKDEGLRIIDIIEAEGSPNPREEYLRQVRLLDCVRQVIEDAHGAAYWAMIYRAADRIRNNRAQKATAWES